MAYAIQNNGYFNKKLGYMRKRCKYDIQPIYTYQKKSKFKKWKNKKNAEAFLENLKKDYPMNKDVQDSVVVEVD